MLLFPFLRPLKLHWGSSLRKQCPLLTKSGLAPLLGQEGNYKMFGPEGKYLEALCAELQVVMYLRVPPFS